MTQIDRLIFIITVLKTANVEVEPYWHGLFAKALEGVNVKDLITNIGSGVGAAHAGVAVALAGGDAPAAKAKKEDEPEESDDNMGFALFD
ncbi:large ribosomal subunit protein P1-like [Haematobia irritans]|uniref:large ribosomal subunit protein P1-like n=1 Tax=Haematobia irritans TaxID=7368 RepID=UPI003F4FA494